MAPAGMILPTPDHNSVSVNEAVKWDMPRTFCFCVKRESGDSFGDL